MNCPEIPVSIGELLDKISILQIKLEYCNDEYIIKELNYLTKIANKIGVLNNPNFFELKRVNKILWKIEDDIRYLEKEKKFDEEFIELARSVYKNNDIRASIKYKINEETNSEFKEIKLY